MRCVLGPHSMKRICTRGFKSSSSLREVVIVSAARTPFGSFMGPLKDLPATKLGSITISSAVERAGITPEQIEEVYMGNVLSAGMGQAPARQAALGAGCLDTTPCTTINKVCASGMKSIMLAAQSIACGARDIMVAGGMESMSNVPMFENRTAPVYGNRVVKDGILHDGLTDAYTPGLHMGHCGEDTASTMSISRDTQDEYTVRSYNTAAAAYQSGVLRAEIVSVPTPNRKNPDLTVTDDTEYANVKFDKIPTLRTVFDKAGTITAANSSKLSDGAAACVLMSRDMADKLGVEPLAKILTMADSAGPPIKFPIAPVRAMELCLENLGISVEDLQRVEVNEAFAVVAVACQQMLNIPSEIYNPNGGAISLGHPIGASGARLIGTMAHTMKSGDKGLTGICNGGGGASAVIIEKF
ncbi:acetyl-CoA acetyltransferase, mitochondrial-like [Bolinopsis microptera]|uniref:acetyl-CoA acetyltransferase, mitochondrial-like n=1 Tax=Bolinopsis microptera TaxID=2820187 RepID=UPI003079F871